MPKTCTSVICSDLFGPAVSERPCRVHATHCPECTLCRASRTSCPSYESRASKDVSAVSTHVQLPRRHHCGDPLRCWLHGRRDRAAAPSSSGSSCARVRFINRKMLKTKEKLLTNHRAVALLCRIRAANHPAAVRPLNRRGWKRKGSRPGVPTSSPHRSPRGTL